MRLPNQSAPVEREHVGVAVPEQGAEASYWMLGFPPFAGAEASFVNLGWPPFAGADAD